MPSTPPAADWRGSRARSGWALGLVAATLFVALSTVRLGAQGAEYDELHQAPGAFGYLGVQPEMFAKVTVGRYPVMTMSYSAAIKSHLYGIYLRLSRRGFEILSWRLCGILLVAAGLALFAVATAPGLSRSALALVLGLILTDTTVLMLGRHDYGPVDLALLLRLLLLGLWVRGETSQPALANTFGIAALAGLAVFEKLSSCVLLAPVALMLLASRRRRRPDHLMIAALGLLAGALPLLLVNLYYFDRSGSWLSLAGVGQGTERSLQGFATFAFEYASLAAGRRAAELVLGLPIARAAETAEVAFAGLALLGVLGTALWRRAPAPLRGAGVVAGGYVAVGVALYGLPRPTDMHHRILGTPFLYLALGLAVSALWGAGPSASVARRAAVALALLGGVWLAARLPRLVAVEGALIEGRASGRFNPSLSALGRFASRQADEAVFIASDWGVATQIYCFANGRPGLVHELYWVYRDFDQIRRLMRGRGTLYLVRCEPPPRVNPEATARIESDVAGSPDWIEVPAESEVATLPGVRVRKYVLRSGGGP